MGPSVRIDRINVEGYRYVLCDSRNDQILLFKNLQLEKNLEEAKLNGIYADKGRIIDPIVEAITIEDTVKQVGHKRKEQNHKIDGAGNTVYSDNLVIPERFAALLKAEITQPESMKKKM